MPSQNKKSNKKAAAKEVRACVAHMREMPCPICKEINGQATKSQPVPSERHSWVSMARVDTPAGKAWVQRTDTTRVPGKASRRTSPANVTATGHSFGQANVTARQLPGKPNNPSKNPVGHPTFVRHFSRGGVNFGVTARGDLWCKTAGGKWQRDRDFSNSGRTGVTNRKPEPNEFFNPADEVIGLMVPRAGTVGSVNRSPFPHRI